MPQTSQTYSIAEIAQALGLEHVGNGDLRVKTVTEPALAGVDDLALAMKPEFAEGIAKGRAKAAMLWAEADWQSYGLEAAILPPRPRYALSKLSAQMDLGPGYGTGIHPSSVIDPTAKIGADVTIGPLAVIAADAEIGEGSVIAAQCFVGWQSVLGPNAILHAGVRIGARVTIGSGFIANLGAVIGGDGFSFVTPETSGVEKARASLGAQGNEESQAWARIHSIGGVTIGDNVEIGANSSVDRGTVRDTVVGSGSKMDSLVQVGHNAVIGKDCLLCAQAGVAGSAVLGNNVVVGGQAGVSDNITVGDRAILGGASVVLSNVPAGRVLLGYPAQKMENQIESYKALRRLPRLIRDVAALKKTVSNTPEKD